MWPNQAVTITVTIYLIDALRETQRFIMYETQMFRRGWQVWKRRSKKLAAELHMSTSGSNDCWEPDSAACACVRVYVCVCGGSSGELYFEWNMGPANAAFHRMSSWMAGEDLQRSSHPPSELPLRCSFAIVALHVGGMRSAYHCTIVSNTDN